MRKPFLTSAFVISIFALATVSAADIGPNYSTGPSVNNHSIFAVGYNPASAAFAVAEDERWRFNISPAIAISAEAGEVDNFADELDELIDVLDDPSSTDDSVEDVLDRFNRVLVEMGDSGYVKSDVSLRLPIIPLYHRSDRYDGTFFVDYQLNAQVGASVLDDELQFDSQNQTFATSSSLYLKSGIENRISVGFGKQLDFESRFGDIYAGARFNFISLDLSKQVIPLQVLDGRNVEDVIEDEYDNNLASNSGVSIDLGAVLARETWRVGLTIANIGEPSFDYGAIGEGCESREENTHERTVCEVSKYFVQTRGEIDGRESHTMSMITTADAALRLRKGVWLNTSLDLAKYNDLVGFENQWFHTGISMDSRGYIMPSLRAGYHINQVDAGITSYTFGLTLLKWLNLDFEYSPDSVEVDGDAYPRKVGFSFSIFERF